MPLSRNPITSSLLATSLLVPAFANFCRSEDWTQWMGNARDGVYRETGIIDRIPAEGLSVVWRAPIAGGYSGPAVAEGRVFVTDYVKQSGEVTNNSGGRDPQTGIERMLCLDAASGQELWKHEYQRSYNISYGSGPRATPTVDADRVYMLGAEGDLHCLKSDSGELVWKKQLGSAGKSESPIWGHAAHPLVHGDLLYCLDGGEGNVVVALNKFSGEVVWHALSAPTIGYCPPTLYTLAGVEQLLIWHPESLNALNPATGEVHWTFPVKPQYEMSIAIPRLNGNLLYVSGIGETAYMLEIGDEGKPIGTKWTGGDPKAGVYCSNSTPSFDGDVIYGADCGSGQFIAASASDGTRYWETFDLTTGGERRASNGTAFLIKHEDRFFIFAETGDLILAKLSKDGFDERGRMRVLEPTNSAFGRDVVWCHPAFANRCMFVRNDKEIVCISLAAEEN